MTGQGKLQLPVSHEIRRVHNHFKWLDTLKTILYSQSYSAYYFVQYSQITWAVQHFVIAVESFVLDDLHKCNIIL